MEDKKIYVGLDLGVENLGYAVTDGDYNILSVGKKKAVGVYTYSSETLKAQTAEGRRAFRIARRRLVRRKLRITLLQEMFAEYMSKTDGNFFAKLNENDLVLEDRKYHSDKYSLFSGKDYNDTDFYKEYPTIYHLRNALLTAKKVDIRMLYLAVHNIIKYRGNFLTTGRLEDVMNVGELFANLNNLLEERNDNYDEDDKVVRISKFDIFEKTDFDKIITSDSIKNKEKKKFVAELTGATEKTQKHIVDIIFGASVNLQTLFGDTIEKDSYAKFSFNEDFEPIKIALSSILEDIDMRVLCQIKLIADYVVLNKILKGSDSISNAMIAKYDKHKSDLKLLKEIVKKYAPSEYNEIFGIVLNNKQKIDDEFVNYTSYIGGGRPLGKDKIYNGRLGATCDSEKFFTYIKKKLENIKDIECKDKIDIMLNDIEEKNFLPKIVAKNNGVIPYQVNEIELEKILDNAILNGHDWLLKCEKHGDKEWSIKDKIISLLKFRIDYYVGPVKQYKEKEKRSKNAWAVRKGSGLVTPWTYDLLIDKVQSNEQFISRMTNSCTFLKDKAALPKNSIVFSKYLVLSELNKLRVNGELLEANIKNIIFDTVYIQGLGKPTIKKIVKCINSQGLVVENISGYDEVAGLISSMSSYKILKNIIGEKIDIYPLMVERIIFLMTIHNDSAMLEQSIKNEFGDKLTDKEIKGLKGITFNGWGAFSLELLAGSMTKDGISLIDYRTGEILDIVDIMQQTNYSFMEIVASKNKIFNFYEIMQKYNIEHGLVQSENISYEDIEDMYCSPAVKRIVWQTFLLFKSIIKDAKIKHVDKVFIEVARSNQAEKKRTLSRKIQLDNLYKSIKQDKNNARFTSNLGELKHIINSEENSYFNNEKLFLYFMQLGRCAYSDEPIDLGAGLHGLEDYDIDHIIPQCKKKDNSLDNRVLVKKSLNSAKSDEYPVPFKYREKAQKLWKFLTEKNLMSKEKYSRLIRSTPITEAEQEKFINRQLVETNQTALLIRDLLERLLNSSGDKKTEINLVKANNVSEFRKMFYLTKSREINDCHHAMDAYLNVIVGNVLFEKFNHSKDYANRNNGETTNFKKVFEGSVWSDREKRFIWTNKADYCTIAKIKKYWNDKDVHISRKIVESKGELYKSTLFKASKEDKATIKYPIQESKIVDGIELNPKSDTSKYGNKKTSGTAYFVVVDSFDKKGNPKRTIEEISIYDNTRIKAGKVTLEDIIKLQVSKDAKIADIQGLKGAKLLIGSLLEYKSLRLRLSGKQGNYIIMHNANQLYLDNWFNRYIKELSVVTDKVSKITAMEKADVKELRQEEELTILENDKKRRQELYGVKPQLITFDSNEKVYDMFINKACSYPYINMPGYSSYRDGLGLMKDSFTKLALYKQVVVLLKLIKAFQCNAQKVDMSDLYYMKNGKKEEGKKTVCSILMSKDITGINLKAINQSKTGLKEKEVCLNKV